MFRTEDYLKRLKIDKAFSPDAESLTMLHYSHLIHIPYENFDIINKMEFSLDEEDLFEKIITGNRGGFCYELIILFKRLLTELGYNVQLLSAKIFHQPDMIPGPEFDHSVLLVKIKDKPWLVDVGNSLWFIKPLMMNSNELQLQNHQSFRILRDGENTYTLAERKNDSDKEIPQYKFDLTPRRNSDFIDICHYKWTSPESKFTKEYICSRITETGRIYLRASGLMILENGVRIELPVAVKDEFIYYLSKYFPDIPSERVK